MDELRLTALLALLLCGCASITHVNVRDREESHWRALSTEELTQFRQLWDEREEVDRPENFHSSVRLSISGHGNSSWSYDTRGYLQLIAVKNSAFYRVRNVAAFNALLEGGVQLSSQGD